MPECPKVSVVTPCFQAARFIRETVESVLGQDYPNLEYIVMDGGSTDGTVEILEGYHGDLEFVSAPDGGQADAINRGFRKSTGEIFAWLNADDTYLPGAIRAAVGGLAAHPEAGAVYGEAFHIDANGGRIGPYPTEDFDWRRLNETCYICQPACFLRRRAFEQAGMLNPALQFALDYDLWIRLGKITPLVRIAGALANSRMHRENKTLGSRRRAYREAVAVVKQHFGYVPYSWIYGYCSHMLDPSDQFFERTGPTLAKRALSLAVGSWHNWRHLARYWGEWTSAMGLGGR
jgi:glycosyltransferase involved in cell wall biosynthesis